MVKIWHCVLAVLVVAMVSCGGGSSTSPMSAGNTTDGVGGGGGGGVGGGVDGGGAGDTEGDTGEGSGDDTTELLGNGNALTVKGSFDAANLSMSKGAGDSPIEIDAIYAIDEEGNITESDVEGGEFELLLDRPSVYTIAFFSNDRFVASYRIDKFELDSLPVLDPDGGTIDLGRIYFTGTYAKSDIDWVDLFDSLLIDEETARQVGLYDDGLIRHNNLNTFKTGGGYDLIIGYGFEGSDGLEGITQEWGDRDSLEYRGFMYYFGVTKYLMDDWPSAYLYMPGDIEVDERGDGKGGLIEEGEGIESCWSKQELDRQFYNHLCGFGGISAQPPEGTYLLEIGGVTFEFENMKSRFIDSTDEVLLPVPKLIINDGKVSKIKYQWWWKDEDGKWKQPNKKQIKAMLGNHNDSAGFGIRMRDNETEFSGNISYEQDGNTDLAVPVDLEDMVEFAISFNDMAGYGYRFYWR